MSTIVLLVLVPTYVHADMSATHENDNIYGAKNGEKWQMSPNVGRTFSDMLPTCRPTGQCRVEIANANIQQTQLSLAPPNTIKKHQKL